MIKEKDVFFFVNLAMEDLEAFEPVVRLNEKIKQRNSNVWDKKKLINFFSIFSQNVDNR